MTNAVILAATLLTASWERFADDGRLAANGRPFNPKAMTCATRRFPLGTRLHVEDRLNHFSCDVVVTDRPARRFGNRLDLSPAAFSLLNGLALGLCPVRVTPIISRISLPPL